MGSRERPCYIPNHLQTHRHTGPQTHTQKEGKSELHFSVMSLESERHKIIETDVLDIFNHRALQIIMVERIMLFFSAFKRGIMMTDILSLEHVLLRTKQIQTH